MKKICIIAGLWGILYGSDVDSYENRKGFMFGEGIVVMGGCYKEDIWDEIGERVIGSKRDCAAFPLLDLGVGYNFTNQFGLSLDIKTLILGSFIGVKAKYYLKDERNTTFVSVTGGALDVGGGHSGPGIGSYNNIEIGYAYGHNEFSIGVGKIYHDSDTTLMHLEYKYVF